jgi:hypothetical protein
MAYDTELGGRIETYLAARPEITSKKMFGGIAYFLNGNLACGVHKDSLIVRVGPDAYKAALEEDLVEEFDITGRPMRGWVMVAPEKIADDGELGCWIDAGVSFAGSLPPKE